MAKVNTLKNEVKSAIKEMQVELFGTQKEAGLGKVGDINVSYDRFMQLEKRFETLCQHLGVHVTKNWKEFDVHDIRPQTTGIGGDTCENLSK